MSFFDQPYYAVTKAHLSGIGIWPEQSKYTRIIRLLTAFALVMSLIVPRLVRWNELWKDTAPLIHDIPILMTGMATFTVTLRLLQHFNEIKLAFEHMERHWEMFINTSAVGVLDKYTERGRCIIFLYTSKQYIFASVTMHNIGVNFSMLICAFHLSVHVYTGMIFYYLLCLSPIILDVIDPLNETRTKIYIFHTEYGVNKDKYYWFILCHEYIVSVVGLVIVVTIETVYFTWAIHACALFEVVGCVYLFLEQIDCPRPINIPRQPENQPVNR